jgi:hypothetical protein
MWRGWTVLDDPLARRRLTVQVCVLGSKDGLSWKVIEVHTFNSIDLTHASNQSASLSH